MKAFLLAALWSASAAAATGDRNPWELGNDQLSPTQLTARHAFLLDERPWLPSPITGLVFGSLGLTVSTASIVIGLASIPSASAGYGGIDLGVSTVFLTAGVVGVAIATAVILIALSKLRTIHRIDEELGEIQELRLSRALPPRGLTTDVSF